MVEEQRVPRGRAGGAQSGTQDGPPPVIGAAEAAAMLGMQRASLFSLIGKHRMQRRDGDASRDLFPEPDWVISGNPVWRPSTVRRWGRATGRIPRD